MTSATFETLLANPTPAEFSVTLVGSGRSIDLVVAEVNVVAEDISREPLDAVFGRIECDDAGARALFDEGDINVGDGLYGESLSLSLHDDVPFDVTCGLSLWVDDVPSSDVTVRWHIYAHFGWESDAEASFTLDVAHVAPR